MNWRQTEAKHSICLQFRAYYAHRTPIVRSFTAIREERRQLEFKPTFRCSHAQFYIHAFIDFVSYSWTIAKKTHTINPFEAYNRMHTYLPAVSSELASTRHQKCAKKMQHKGTQQWQLTVRSISVSPFLLTPSFRMEQNETLTYVLMFWSNQNGAHAAQQCQINVNKFRMCDHRMHKQIVQFWFMARDCDCVRVSCAFLVLNSPFVFWFAHFGDEDNYNW